MPMKRLWYVERVYGKLYEDVEVSSVGETRHVKNILHREIHPGNFLILEGDLIMDVLKEGQIKK